MEPKRISSNFMEHMASPHRPRMISTIGTTLMPPGLSFGSRLPAMAGSFTGTAGWRLGAPHGEMLASVLAQVSSPQLRDGRGSACVNNDAGLALARLRGLDVLGVEQLALVRDRQLVADRADHEAVDPAVLDRDGRVLRAEREPGDLLRVHLVADARVEDQGPRVDLDLDLEHVVAPLVRGRVAEAARA